MNDVLLTVSGVIDPDIERQIAQGLRPQADYVAMAQAFGADLLDYAAARGQTGWLGQMLEKIGGPNLMLAWACYRGRHRYRVIFTDGEQIGLPLAFLLKFLSWGSRPRHLMIAHILSVGKKMTLLDWLGLHSHIDLFFVYSTWQKQFIESRWHVPDERVVFTPFMVDADFFAPDQAQAVECLALFQEQQRPIICSVGLEFRDYPTLLKAVEGLDVQVIIAAASPWSKRADTTTGQKIPENVLVQRFTQYELRYLYALSQFMVMPLYAVNFQAGVTAILEAMAMNKALICSRTVGQTDIILEGETGVYVPPQDPEALRENIVRLLSFPQTTEQMGAQGRQRVEQELSLKRYVVRLNSFVQKARAAPSKKPPDQAYQGQIDL